MAHMLYVTTKCNLDCDYCYEQKDRNKLNKHKELTIPEIDEYLSQLNKIEPDVQSKVVIFGGEPFL